MSDNHSEPELSQDAVTIAEGWMLLPAEQRRYVKAIIDSNIARMIPAVQTMYSSASYDAQERFNRMVVAIQAHRRRKPDR